MDGTGERELRQQASKDLERVEAREYLVATAQLHRGDGRDVRDVKPAGARRRQMSDALAELRENER